MPFGVTMLRVTSPRVPPAGLTATIRLSETEIMPGVDVFPKRTSVAELSPEPAMETCVPPLVGPAAGEMEVIVGAADISHLFSIIFSVLLLG